MNFSALNLLISSPKSSKMPFLKRLSTLGWRFSRYFGILDSNSKRTDCQEIEVEIPTTLVSQIEFESGALIDSFFSFDVWKHSKNHIELYGDKGSINIPDPNMFGGDILVCKTKNGDWKKKRLMGLPWI